MKEFNSSYSEIDEMELETLLELINVYEKLNTPQTKDNKKTVTYKVLD